MQEILHQVNKTYWKILQTIYVWQNIHIDVWKEFIHMWKVYKGIKIHMISRYDIKK